MSLIPPPLIPPSPPLPSQDVFIINKKNPHIFGNLGRDTRERGYIGKRGEPEKKNRI
jgi:hypothetical protein